MPVSASEIERMESRDGSKKKASRRRYTEAYRVEAVLRAEEKCGKEIIMVDTPVINVDDNEGARREAEQTIKECAKELGVNEKTFNDWVVKYEAAGKVERGRTEEQRALDEANRRIRELEMENEFLKKASAFFARNQA